MSKEIRSNIQAVVSGGPQIPTEYGERKEADSFKNQIQNGINRVYAFAYAWWNNRDMDANMKDSKPLDHSSLYPFPESVHDTRILDIFVEIQPLQYFSQRSYMEALFYTNRFFEQLQAIENDEYGSGGRLCIEYYHRLKETRRYILNLLYSIYHAMDIGYENAAALLSRKIDELEILLNHYLRIGAGRCNQLRARIHYPPVEEVGEPRSSHSLFETETDTHYFNHF